MRCSALIGLSFLIPIIVHNPFGIERNSHVGQDRELNEGVHVSFNHSVDTTLSGKMPKFKLIQRGSVGVVLFLNQHDYFNDDTLIYTDRYLLSEDFLHINLSITCIE
jgi:hypothetical protein